MSARAELSSVATGLDELVGRINAIVEGLGGLERDAIGADLYELERTLNTARRRLAKVVDANGGR
jgi:hypothetical protein